MDHTARIRIALLVVVGLAVGCSDGGGPRPPGPQTLFFAASDAAHGRELWTSDGTAAGTRMVADLVPGEGGLSPQHLVPFSCGVLFSGDDGVHGPSLWASDGTAAGTRLLLPGLTLGRAHTVMGGLAYVVLCDPAEACALWRTDGTEAGTSLVKDGLRRDAELIHVEGLYRLFFPATDEAHGEELWTSFGWSNPQRVADLVPGPGSFSPHHLTGLLDGLLFAGDDGVHGPSLWRSDGTEAGTVLVQAGLEPVSPFVGASWIGMWAVLCDPAGACAVWGTNGNDVRLTQVKDGLARDASVVESGDAIFFPAADEAHGEELWRSDGVADARMVADVVPGAGSLSPRRLFSMGRGVLFAADDGVHGPSLWKSDGTAAGTTVLQAGVVPETYGWRFGGGAYAILREAADPAACGLWKTDGTEAGTAPLAAGVDCAAGLVVVGP